MLKAALKNPDQETTVCTCLRCLHDCELYLETKPSQSLRAFCRVLLHAHLVLTQTNPVSLIPLNTYLGFQTPMSKLMPESLGVFNIFCI